MGRTAKSPKQILQAMAEALGRETWDIGFGRTVDLEPVGPVGHDRAIRIAKLARRLGILETRGYVQMTMNRMGEQVGWKLTKKGQEKSR